MSNWKLLVGEDSVEPIIVMCPEGGELNCYRDGSVVAYEGARMWGFRLPPSVRLFFDASTPLANVDREMASGND